MLIKSILTATAIALAVGVGSASAGERFSNMNEFSSNLFDTLTGLHAIPMMPYELATIKGSHLRLITNGVDFKVDNFPASIGFMGFDIHTCFVLSFGAVTFTSNHC